MHGNEVFGYVHIFECSHTVRTVLLSTDDELR